VVPRAPIRPNVPLNAAAGLAVGLLLGIGAAIGRAALDRTLKTPADVEENVKGTFLGLIPQFTDTPGSKRKRREAVAGAPELIVHLNPMSGTAEASRSVRTNLLFSNPDRPYRVLLVTSAGTAEGKTTVATCIATAMAQAGKRVLLIDCDLRRPRVHRIFGGRKDLGPGLTTALLDPTVEDCAAPTEVPNLFVIPAGPVPPNPSELLSSERFKAFLASMRDKFDQIILDSPPIGAVTDGTILSTIADGTVLVVRAFVTNKDLARHARRVLSDVGATFAGVVLNAVNLERTDYAYAYHYYRRDGYYADSDTQRPPS
jgi:polysaccharide biosynthesis transport protein